MTSTVVIASAGSGKTTHLITEAVARPDARILITTYTNENTDNIRDCLIERFGCIPPNITVATWFNVLLIHGVRPYQNLVSAVELSRSIALIDVPDTLRYVPKTNIERYFFTAGGDILKDRVSDFICLTDDKTNGAVIRRLEGIFTHIFIDELQDLAGHDLTLLEKLFRSRIEVLAVGDPRQATFTTNNSTKNKGVSGAAIVLWIAKIEKEGLVRVNELRDTWRSNQVICDFADALYPDMRPTTSKNTEMTEHDGIFEIPATDAAGYYATYNPVVLRYSKTANTQGLPAMNIGLAKGRTFDRVLIFTTKPMRDYLKSRDPAVAGDVPKFYVAVTRARFSVAFVV